MAKFLDDTGLATFWAKIKSLVTGSIQALDVSSVGGSGKYISAISESDGKISATATTMDTTPTASSQKAVTSGGIKTAIDNASTADRLYANQKWGGDFRFSLSPIDVFGMMGHNVFLGALASCIKVEYSTDGGTTWLDYGLTDTQKMTLFSQFSNSAIVYCGKNTHIQPGYTGTIAGTKDLTNEIIANQRLRITISSRPFANEGTTSRTGEFAIVNRIRRLGILMSTQSAGYGTHCVVSTRTTANFEAGNDVWATHGDFAIVGDSGWNSIPCDNGTEENGFVFGGYGTGGTTQYNEIRFEIWSTQLRANPASSQTGNLAIFAICGLADKINTTASKFGAFAKFGYNCTSVDLANGYPVFGNGIKFTARKLKTNLARTADSTFDGSANQENIPVTGTLPVGNGGTGKASVTANSYLKGNGTGALVERTYAEVRTDLGISDGANKVEASTTNGKIKIDGTDTTVYTHPSTTAAAASAKKVGKDALGHVVLGDALAKGDVGLGNVNNTAISVSATNGVTDSTNNVTYKYTHPSQTPYTQVGSSSKVPKITTDSTGHVTEITECDLYASTAEWLIYQYGDEIDYKNVPTFDYGGAYKHRHWFNRRNGDNYQTTGDNPLKEYYFGNRMNGMKGVSLHAEALAFRTIGCDNSANHVFFAKITMSDTGRGCIRFRLTAINANSGNDVVGSCDIMVKLRGSDNDWHIWYTRSLRSTESGANSPTNFLKAIYYTTGSVPNKVIYIGVRKGSYGTGVNVEVIDPSTNSDGVELFDDAFYKGYSLEIDDFNSSVTGTIVDTSNGGTLAYTANTVGDTGGSATPVYVDSLGKLIACSTMLKQDGSNVVTNSDGSGTLATMFATMPTWTAAPTVDTYFIRQDTAGANKFGRVKFSTIYQGIKNRVYADRLFSSVQLGRGSGNNAGAVGMLQVIARIPSNWSTLPAGFAVNANLIVYIDGTSISSAKTLDFTLDYLSGSPATGGGTIAYHSIVVNPNYANYVTIPFSGSCNHDLAPNAQIRITADMNNNLGIKFWAYSWDIQIIY